MMMRMLMPALAVGAGGFIGSLLRYALSLGLQRWSITFPHGTLWANLLGCLVIGIIVALAAATNAIPPTLRLFLATGLCGGFTTMSSFIYELEAFLRRHDYAYAAGYFALTFAGCLAMFYVGSLLVRLVVKS